MFIFSVFKPEELSCSQSWSLLPWGTSLAGKEHNWMKHYLSSPSASAISSFSEINLSVEVQVKQATIQMKKSGVSLHTLIYNKLHSVISCFTCLSYVLIKEFSCGSIWIGRKYKKGKFPAESDWGQREIPFIKWKWKWNSCLGFNTINIPEKERGMPSRLQWFGSFPRVLWLYLLVPLT